MLQDKNQLKSIEIPTLILISIIKQMILISFYQKRNIP